MRSHDFVFISFGTDLLYHRLADLWGQCYYATAAEFYSFVQNRVLITFKPLHGGAGVEQFDLAVRKNKPHKAVSLGFFLSPFRALKTGTWQLLLEVGRHLQYEPQKLRFKSAFSNGTPRSPLRLSGTGTVSDIIRINPGRLPVIFYEKVEVC